MTWTRPGRSWVLIYAIFNVGGQWREVVHPIGVGDELQIGPVLGDLLHPAMEVAQMRDALHDGLAVELEHQAQHAMGRRMGRPHVDRDDVGVILGSLEGLVHQGFISLGRAGTLCAVGSRCSRRASGCGAGRGALRSRCRTCRRSPAHSSRRKTITNSS